MISFLFNTLFFIIPLVFYKNTSELFEFNKIIVLYIFTTSITATWLINSIKAKKLIFRKTILDWPLIIYLSIYLISSLFSIDPRTSWLGYYSRFNGGLISQICYAVLYWAFVSNMDKIKGLRVMSYGLAGTAIASILAILERFGIFTTCGLMGFGYKESCWVQDVQNRVFSTLGQPNWLAALLVALIPISWAYILRHKAYSIFFVLFFVTLLFTKSRSGLLAFGIEFIIFWGFAFWKDLPAQAGKFKYLKEFLIIFFVSVFIYFAVNPSLVTRNLSETVSNGPALEVGGTESGTIRKYVWLGALEVFKHYPILGTGPETFAFSFPMFKPVEHNLTSEWDFIYNKAHNEFLNYLANTGILGFLSYTNLIIFSIIIFWKQKRFDLLSGYIAILVTSFFGFSVVPVSLLFFLLPAISLVISNERLVISKNQKLNINQWLLVMFVLFTSLYSLFSILSYWQADIYYSKSKSTNNTDDINKAISISPKEPLYVSQLAFINSDVNKSLEALKLSSYNQNVRKVLLSNLIKTDNQKAAVEMLLDGIDKSPNDPKLYYQLGIIQLKLDETDKGLKSLIKAVELKSNYKEGRFALGVTYKALKENLKAKEQFEYILKNIDPNDELTKKYLDEIN